MSSPCTRLDRTGDISALLFAYSFDDCVVPFPLSRRFLLRHVVMVQGRMLLHTFAFPSSSATSKPFASCADRSHHLVFNIALLSVQSTVAAYLIHLLACLRFFFVRFTCQSQLGYHPQEPPTSTSTS